MTIQKLHYENLGGLLVRREGMLHWRCPDCKEEGASEVVMQSCPKCGNPPSVKSKSLPRPIFQPNDDYVVPTNVLNNMWRIIGQETAITADQHRDLQNLMNLAKMQGDYLK